MALHQVGDLEINEDLEFEHRSWQVQRVAWAILGLVVLAALLGLLGGGGPLSVARAGQGSPLEITYARFARHNNPVEMAVRLRPGAAPGDEARLWISSAYLDAVKIERIEPEPAQVVLGADRVTYVFRQGAGEGGRVVLHIMPQHVGRHEARVGLEGGPEHTLSQIVYP